MPSNTSTFFRPLIAAGVLSGLAFTPLANAQVVPTTYIVKTGDAAPGAGTGTTFLGTFSGVTNEVGDFAFQAVVQGPTITTANQTGDWKYSSAGALSLVARMSDVPAGAPGTTFTSVRVPFINDTGDVAFRGVITGAGITLNVNDFGIWQYGPTGNALRTITGSAAVGYSGNTVTGLGVPGFGPGRTMAYIGSVSGFSTFYPTLANMAYFGQNSTPAFSFTRALSHGDGVAPYGAVWFTSGVTTPIFVNASRQVIVQNLGFWTCNPGDPNPPPCGGTGPPTIQLLNPGGSPAVQLIAKNGTLVGPGTSLYYPGSVLGFNNSGLILFQGFLFGGAGTTGILCTGDVTHCSALVAPGSPVAGSSPPATFGNSFLPQVGCIDGLGRWAFCTGGFNAAATANSGIFISGGPYNTVALEGAHPPGTPAYVVLDDLANVPTLAINGNGDLAFAANLRGPGVTAANNRGLFLRTSALGLIPVVVLGDTLSPGGVPKTVSTFSFNLNTNGSGPEDGRARAIGRSSTGATQLVYSVTFTDGTAALAIAKLPTSITGACCVSGGCTLTTSGGCTGSYLGNFELCSPNPCTGACCTATNCAVMEQSACTGVYQGNATTCTLVPCTGACCVTTSCTTTTQAACTPGTYQGNNTLCTPNPCVPTTGGCCTSATGACANGVDQATCTATGGNVWLGAGQACTLALCPLPTGGCCTTATGACANGVDQATCVGSAGNVWLGAGQACTLALCPLPTGGCCTTATGACANAVDQATCTGTAGNTWLGANVACTVVLCPLPTGACCDGLGGCSPQTAANCTPAGAFQGVGVACGPTNCGVCCRGSTCVTSIYTSADCQSSLPPGSGAGFTYIASTACGGANHKVPCCFADYNKVGGKTVADIFAYLTDWFAHSAFAWNGTPGASGPGNPPVSQIFAFLSDWFAGC